MWYYGGSRCCGEGAIISYNKNTIAVRKDANVKCTNVIAFITESFFVITFFLRSITSSSFSFFCYC